MISSVDLQRITTLIFDIDGTLTDGKVAYGESGDVIKFFDIADLHWLKLALRAGLKVGILSGRHDFANDRMIADVKLSFALQGAKDKAAGFEQLLRENNLTAGECLCVGDDVVDMPMLRRAGIGVAVANAAPELDEVASFRTTAPGGGGAAAEIVRMVLKEKNLFDQIMERYRR